MAHSLLPPLLYVPVPHTLQKVVLSYGSGPGLDLPLVLGLPLQLKLDVSKVLLSQGPKKMNLALPPVGLDSLLSLWAHPQGRLFVGTLPGKRECCSSSSHHWKQLKAREKISKGLIVRGKKRFPKMREDRGQWEEVL